MRRSSAAPVLAASCLLVMLRLGRDVLAPIALALVLALVIAPLARGLRRCGLGDLAAALLAVVVLGAGVAGAGAVLATQLVAVTGELPQYRAAIRARVADLRDITERPFARLEAELGALTPPAPPPPAAGIAPTRLAASGRQPVAVEIVPPLPTTSEMLAHLASLAAGPIGATGLVAVLLVFILLERETLLERIVRLAGQSGAARTIKALGDAAQGVSRFFLSLFAVNTAFGATIGIALYVLDVPHALLWGTLSGLLRFVPYLGVLGAASLIAGFAAAISPGWDLIIACLGLFLVLELVVANVVEPKLYGRGAGISPLAVIVSALFWGFLWGPTGLLLSTPLTLCIVVAGRHVRWLEPVTILLGDAPDVSLGQRFYQRALSGETGAIVHDARIYLRRSSFARYCDQILLPGLALVSASRRAGELDAAQLECMRATIAEVAARLAWAGGDHGKGRMHRRVSLLDANVGAHLRHLREQRLGRWQGPLEVPARSIVLCASLVAERDDVLSELLVLALREAKIDARSTSIAPGQEHPGQDKAGLVSTVFLAYPLEATFGEWLAAIRELRARLPGALLVTIRLPFAEGGASLSLVEQQVDLVLRSYQEGLAFASGKGEGGPVDRAG